MQVVVVDPPASALRETAESIAALLEAGGGAVIEAEGTPAAAILWQVKAGGLYLCRLAVDPGHRRRGHARRLVAAAEDEARRRRLPRLHLGTRLVLHDNRRLFVACGFAEVRRHAHEGYAEPTWVEMEKRLDCGGAEGLVV